jgi:NAD(P)-dependent dehydrogenase (short-subunit alcohol dehydrogenase family)
MLERGGGTIINVTSPVATNDPPAPAGEGGWGLAYAMSKGAMHRMAGILAVELGPLGIRAFNLDPGFVVTERMAILQGEHGLQSYRGAPPSVPGAVVAWLAGGPAGADELNGKTIVAQKLALQLDLHPDWR